MEENELMKENELVEETAPKNDDSIPGGKKSVCSIIALVIGILSIVCCIGGSVLGVIGIILAVVALAGRKEPKRKIAVAGLVTSIIGLILGIVIIVAAVLSYQTVKKTAVEQLGITEEQFDLLVEVVGENITPQQVQKYTDLYTSYTEGTLKPEDVTLDKLGIKEDREFTDEEVDALKALAESLGIDESVYKDLNKDNIKDSLKELESSLTEP